MFRKPKYYNSCKTLPLSIFIDVLEDEKNIDKLVISGKVKTDYLFLLWENIFEEYNELNGSGSSKAMLRKSKFISKQKIKIIVLSRALNSLAMKYHLPTILFLKEQGFRTEIRYKTFFEDFKKANAELKGIISQVEQAEQELKGNEKIDVRKEFTQTLLSLSKFLGFNYSKENTVYEFCQAVKLMNESVKINNNGKRA